MNAHFHADRAAGSRLFAGSVMLVISAVFVALGGVTPALAQEEAGEIQPYPLDICIVSGEALGAMGAPVVHHNEGRLVRFCCAGCIPAFEEDPAKYMQKIDAAEAR